MRCVCRVARSGKKNPAEAGLVCVKLRLHPKEPANNAGTSNYKAPENRWEWWYYDPIAVFTYVIAVFTLALRAHRRWTAVV
jgi:hypothetical protein